MNNNNIGYGDDLSNDYALELDNELDVEFSYVETMLSTIDNPYDYFTQFDEWFMYDNEKGYNCCGYLDRIITLLGGIDDDFTEREEREMIEKAIDEIVAINPLGIYIKVSRTVTEQPDGELTV